MRYLLLICRDEAKDALATPAEQEARNQAYSAFSATARDAIRGGEAIAEAATATTVRVRDDGQQYVLTHLSDPDAVLVNLGHG